MTAIRNDDFMENVPTTVVAAIAPIPARNLRRGTTFCILTFPSLLRDLRTSRRMVARICLIARYLKPILNAELGPCKGVQLERQLRSHLSGPVSANRVGHMAESAGCICAKALTGFVELRRIGDAEGFGAKLQVHPLFNRKAPEYRGVQIKQPWSAEGSAGHITQNADCSLAKWPSALPAIARRHIEPRLTRTDAVQYLERADQVRRLRIPRRVQN